MTAGKGAVAGRGRCLPWWLGVSKAVDALARRGSIFSVSLASHEAPLLMEDDVGPVGAGRSSELAVDGRPPLRRDADEAGREPRRWDRRPFGSWPWRFFARDAWSAHWHRNGFSVYRCGDERLPRGDGRCESLRSSKAFWAAATAKLASSTALWTLRMRSGEGDRCRGGHWPA